jgi:hypothetical protein
MAEIDRRVERAARAMARYRLGGSVFAAGLPSEQARSIHEAAVERLWPSLVDEAAAVVEAIDANLGQREREPPLSLAMAATSIPHHDDL